MSHEGGASHQEKFGRNSKGFGIAIVALIMVLLGLIAWWLWNKGHMEAKHYRFDKETTAGHSGHTGAGEAATTPLAVGALDSLGNFIYNVGDTIDLDLGNGTLLRVGKNSTEAKLFSFLNDSQLAVDTVDKTKGWITLDRVFFETGSSKLTETSKAQVSNISNILKHFAAAEVKLGGYTDNTGDSAVNMRVSQQRADAVMAALKGNGTTNKLAAEGYGPQWPLADNATAEGKAMNRRVDIRVTKK